MNFTPVDPNTLQPDLYTRMPKPGRRYQGMCRTTLQNLGDDGFIDVISVQRPGRGRGVKLIYVPSLLDYLDGLRRNQAEPQAGARPERNPASAHKRV